MKAMFPKALLAGMIIFGSWVTLWSQTYPGVGFSNSTTPMSSATNELTVHSTVLPTGIQQLVVMDTSARTMAVYHVEQGKLMLRSVRNITWDLQMEQFNGQAPLPSELRQVSQ